MQLGVIQWDAIHHNQSNAQNEKEFLNQQRVLADDVLEEVIPPERLCLES
jgi:hypothetical protein